MAHTTNNITAPVSIYDVQQVLGIGRKRQGPQGLGNAKE